MKILNKKIVMPSGIGITLYSLAVLTWLFSGLLSLLFQSSTIIPLICVLASIIAMLVLGINTAATNDLSGESNLDRFEHAHILFFPLYRILISLYSGSLFFYALMIVCFCGNRAINLFFFHSYWKYNVVITLISLAVSALTGYIIGKIYLYQSKCLF